MNTPILYYSGTVFAGRHLRPSPVMLLLRGILQDQSTAQLARELSSRTTVHEICKQLFANFLRPFRGVHKQYRAGDIAIYELRINSRKVMPEMISELVKIHDL